MKKYVCPVCGYETVAEAKPDTCPVCGIDGAEFIEHEVKEDAGDQKK